MKIYKTKLTKKQIDERTVGLAELTKGFNSKQTKLVEEQKKYYRMVMEIRKVRQEKRLTQDQLAQKANLPRTTITKIESGIYNPTINTLMSIATAMGKNLEVKFV